MKYRSTAIVITIIFLCIFMLTQCMNAGEEKSTFSTLKFSDFAGSSTCANCHKDIYESHKKTAHFHTSELATTQSIKGSFDTGKNTFRYSNGTIVAMQNRSDSFVQVGYINGEEKKCERFDIVVGSGTKGQTYLSWFGNKLVQLPITYFTQANQWCNSPGYPDKMAFNRPVTTRCLECHSSFAETVSDPMKEPVQFEKNQIILGVDCEKCHGPAAKHVAFQTKNPTEKTAKFIENIRTFSRQQSLDMCALCHGGRMQKTKPSFTFQAGDKLADYFLIDSIAKDANNIDVHGNQFGLLAASKCFKMSNSLTCITCHNVHENEKGKTELFSQRCISCHNNKDDNAVLCKLTKTIGQKINNNCTNCHMPKQPSMAIAVLLQGNTIPTSAAIHTHYIKVYPEETKTVMEFINKK